MTEAPLTAATLAEAVALADAVPALRDAAAALRQRFPAMRIVVVDAFDMRGETPAALGTRRALYLGGSDGHCWQVTTDPAVARGLFVSERA